MRVVLTIESYQINNNGEKKSVGNYYNNLPEQKRDEYLPQKNILLKMFLVLKSNSMKSCVLFFSILLVCSKCFAQKDTVLLVTSFNTHQIINNSDFNLSIIAYNKSGESINIPTSPKFSGSDNGSVGQVQFELEKLSNNFYEKIIIDVDYFGLDTTLHLKPLKPQDSATYQSDIRNLFVMRKGAYRLKTYLVYFRSNPSEGYLAVSDWLYFEVKTDKYPFGELR